MKKGTKAILIVAAVMILTGSIMSIICLALGARWQDTGAYWYGFFGWGMGNYSEGRLEAAPEAPDAADAPVEQDGQEYVQDEDYRRWIWREEEIHSLDLSVDVGEMVVEWGDTFLVEVEHPRDGFSCEIKDGTLVVDEDGFGSPWQFFDGNGHPVIHVKVPAGITLLEVKCKVGIGSIAVSNIDAESMEIDVDAGSFTGFVRVDGKLHIDVDAGSAEITRGSCGGNLSVDVDAGSVSLWEFEGRTADFDADAGSIEYSGVLEGSWKADCDVGSVDISLQAQERDYNYNVENDMGSVEIGGQSFSGFSDHTKVENGANKTASIDCDMGSVYVSFY